MRYTFFFSVLSVILFSCSDSSNLEESVSNNKKPASDNVDRLNVQMDHFEKIDTSGILMFPLSMGESRGKGSSLSYKEMPEGMYWNVIFLNTHTDEYHLLDNRKMLIRNIAHNNEVEDARQKSTFIFYSITTDDINHDKLLNGDDPVYLFITNREGQNFQRISPKNYDVVNWATTESSRKIIITARRDSDGNNKFDSDDGIATFVFDPSKDKEASEVFSSEFKKSLRTLYDKDWKRIKP